MKQFFTLFSISLRHDFYVSQQAKDLSLRPVPETQRLMDQYDLRGVSKAGVYELYYAQSKAQSPLLSYIKGAMTLRFILSSDNPYFFNISELPFPRDSSQKMLFHNLRAAVPGEQEIPLAQENGIAGPADVSSKNLGLNPGDLALIEMHIGRTEPHQIQPPGPDPVPALAYQLHFLARSTRWRYFFISRENPDLAPEMVIDLKSLLQLADIKISDSGQNATAGQESLLLWEEGKARRLKGSNQTAVPISFKEEFRLKERPERHPKIHLGSKTGGQPRLVSLPTPDWLSVSPEMEQETQIVFSDMFVYL